MEKEWTYNKGFVYYDGYVVISDENGNQKVEDYYDNLGKVLAKENTIRCLNLFKADYSKSLASFEKSENFAKGFLWACGVSSIAAPIGTAWAFAGINPAELYTTKAEVGTIVTIPGIVMGGMLLSIFGVDYYRNGVKNARGDRVALEYIDRRLEEETKELEELKKDKRVSTKLIRNKFYEVNNENTFRKLINKHVIGRDYKKYYKAYKNGTLDTALSSIKEITDQEIEDTKRTMEEKGLSLIKRKK